MGYFADTLGLTEEEWQERLKQLSRECDAEWELERKRRATTTDNVTFIVEDEPTLDIHWLRYDTSPIQEIDTEIWNDPNSLLMFCMGTFEEWEIKEIERKISDWSPVELLLNLRGMAKSHFYHVHNPAIPLQLDVKNLPEPNGEEIELEIHEILLLKNIDGTSVNVAYRRNDGIDYETTFVRLFRGGYVSYADVSFTLNKLKVAELKELLKTHGLRPVGKKQDIIAQITTSFTKEEQAMFERCYFRLTPKGQQMRKDNEYLYFYQSLKSTLSLSLQDVYDYHHSHPDATTADIGIALLAFHEHEALERKNFGHYRNALFSMSEIYRHNALHRMATHCLVQVLYLDFLMDIQRNWNIGAAPGITARVHWIMRDHTLGAEEFDAIFIEAITEVATTLSKHKFPYIPHSINDFREELRKEIGI